jgi:hypothetical protein
MTLEAASDRPTVSAHRLPKVSGVFLSRYNVACFVEHAKKGGPLWAAEKKTTKI